MAVGSMSAFMDQLVAGARSSRDAAFNTLDAVERQTRAASSQLAAHAQKFVADNPVEPSADQGAPAPAEAPIEPRDARFDPEEDEWEVGPGATAVAARPVSESAAPARFAGDEDDEDFPETWLR